MNNLFSDLSDDDFELVEKARHETFTAPVMVRFQQLRTAKRLVMVFAADVVDAVKFNSVRAEWNRVKGVYRLTADPMSRWQLASLPRTDRQVLRIPFPEADLYEPAGYFPATFSIDPDARKIMILIPQEFMRDPAPKPRTLPAPRQVEILPPRHPGAPLDDPKVVAAALGLSEEKLQGKIGVSKFTAAEGEILKLLVSREKVTRQAIMLATADPEKADDDDRDDKLADVLICKIRPKLRANNIEITTLWGDGFAIAAGMRRQLKKLIEDAREADE